MNLEDAMTGVRVSQVEALRELRSHQVEALIQDGELFVLDEAFGGGDGDEPGTWARTWVRCEMNSRSILEFLGY